MLALPALFDDIFFEQSGGVAVHDTSQQRVRLLCGCLNAL
jgi:hypothetical protein